MGHGRKDKWSAGQVDAVKAAGLRGMGADAIRVALLAGELPGYSGDPMPRSTVQYHVARAKRQLLEDARAKFEPAALDSQIGGLLAGMLRGAEAAARKAERELRASKPGAWGTLEEASKALLAAHRVSRAINGPNPGQRDVKTPAKTNGDNTSGPADLVSRIAESERESAAQPG